MKLQMMRNRKTLDSSQKSEKQRLNLFFKNNTIDSTSAYLQNIENVDTRYKFKKYQQEAFAENNRINLKKLLTKLQSQQACLQTKVNPQDCFNFEPAKIFPTHSFLIVKSRQFSIKQIRMRQRKAKTLYSPSKEEKQGNVCPKQQQNQSQLRQKVRLLVKKKFSQINQSKTLTNTRHLIRRQKENIVELPKKYMRARNNDRRQKPILFQDVLEKV